MGSFELLMRSKRVELDLHPQGSTNRCLSMKDCTMSLLYLALCIGYKRCAIEVLIIVDCSILEAMII